MTRPRSVSINVGIDRPFLVDVSEEEAAEMGLPSVPHDGKQVKRGFTDLSEQVGQKPFEEVSEILENL
ncbi:MAG: hypothetical protein UT00_C0015G0004 [Parcubacteria group bacterium GW2011_GWA1_38_7]|nr:MAG: hypothetical protein UT00_C0015G0004 [Parcubacteria group bacterium GW2011_GWA1_38_7]